MTIGIEAERANIAQKTGVEHYAKQLILQLSKIDSHNQYILYLRTKPESWFLNLPKNFKIKVMPFPVFWTQIRLSLEMLFNSPDVLFIPASAAPIIHPKKTVVTIHDLAWKFYPETFTKFMRNFLDWSTGFAARRASNVIAVSESTKKDLVKFYEIEESKVRVIHHGFDEEASGNSTEQTVDNLPEEYVLFLSTLQPRKNLEKLIDAFRIFKNNNREFKHRLVVVGRPGWKFEDILKKIKFNSDIVTYLNYLPDEQRIYVLKHAAVLAVPSLYEGFGMQILEAFAAGVPIITSNISSMPEVAKEAAVYFNPNDERDIAKAIKNVLSDKALSENLVSKGKERLKNFSWQKCAIETLEVLKS